MKRFTLEYSTEGNTDIINLSSDLSRKADEVGGAGLMHIFVTGSTASITTMEFETGLVHHDLPAALQRLIPDDLRYEHEATWNDDNGHSHIRHSIFGTEITVPFENGKLLTGEWQQVVLIDFDTRPRRRTVIVTVMQ